MLGSRPIYDTLRDRDSARRRRVVDDLSAGK
jgi:hypothetical protein